MLWSKERFSLKAFWSMWDKIWSSLSAAPLAGSYSARCMPSLPQQVVLELQELLLFQRLLIKYWKSSRSLNASNKPQDPAKRDTLVNQNQAKINIYHVNKIVSVLTHNIVKQPYSTWTYTSQDYGTEDDQIYQNVGTSDDLI